MFNNNYTSVSQDGQDALHLCTKNPSQIQSQQKHRAIHYFGVVILGSTSNFCNLCVLLPILLGFYTKCFILSICIKMHHIDNIKRYTILIKSLRLFCILINSLLVLFMKCLLEIPINFIISAQDSRYSKRINIQVSSTFVLVQDSVEDKG